MYDLGKLIEKSERQRNVLISADCLISKLDNLYGEYEKKFDQTGEVLFEQAMDVIEKVQRIVLNMKDGKKDG